jgi:hypothetical protein
MNPRAKKILLLLLAAGLLVGTAQVQKSLNLDRQQLDLTRMEPLKNAPPLLAFTTVALGGFRGLISNFLWIHANNLQQEDKFFEMVQLSDWITNLEPHFAQVWAYEAWNMAWNISVKFKDFSDRWRWVQRGMELLRDEGLRYNPNETLLYQQLSWIFQSKMGQNSDDANQYYKKQWAEEMMPFFGPNGTNFDELIHPQTAEAKTRANLLQEKYKIDPVLAEKVDKEWGPLDWRLPEAHAIYWATLGLKKASENPTKVKQSELITLRRSIYQSILQAFQHGHLVINPFDKTYNFYPNLNIVSKLNDTYEIMYTEEPSAGQKEGIQIAQKNFLRDAVYFLYVNNRIAEAATWYRYLGQKYPDKPVILSNPNSLPAQTTLDEFAIALVQEDIGGDALPQDRTTSAIGGLLAHAYYELAVGDDDRYAGFRLLAGKIYEHYQSTLNYANGQQRVGIPPLADINRAVLNQLLDPKQGLPYAMRAVIRTQLSLPSETNPPPASAISTNAVPNVSTSTNAATVPGK